MNLNDIIHKFDLVHFNHALANDMNEMELFYEVLLARCYTGSDIISNDGKVLDRKLLYTWKEKGVFPYAPKSGWAKFNFCELCWLRVVMELRLLGVGFEKIIKLKDYFFHDEEYKRELYNYNIKEMADNNTAENWRVGVVDESGSILAFEDLERIAIPESGARFFHTLLGIILTRHNVIMCLDGNGNVEFYDMEMPTETESAPEIPAWKALLMGPPFVTVNLTNVIKDVSQTHDVFTTKDGLLYFKQSALEAVQKLFRENNISELKIRLNNDQRPIIEVKRKLTFKELNQKVYELQRKGVFRDIVIKTRDGKVQYFESTDLIRL